MQEIDISAISIPIGKRQKKRLQYKRMPEDKKRDLIFRVMYLNENVRSVCNELEFNFSTGRNLVQKYKKTGEYNASEKTPVSSDGGNGAKNVGTKDTDGRSRKCPFGLLILDDDKVQLATSKNYSSQEEQALLKMHSQLVGARLI